MGFEFEVGQLLAEVDQLHEEVDRKARELDAASQNLAEQKSQLEIERAEVNRLSLQFEHQEARLAETTSQLSAAQAELDELRRDREERVSRQRDELAGELKQLRKLVENQAAILAALPATVCELVAAESKEIVPEAAEQGPDPVISSVMAQFSKLQQDIAQRRKK